MTTKKYLPTVSDADEAADSIIRISKEPAFQGDEDQSLACANCTKVFARNVSARTLQSQLDWEGQRLLYLCSCGAYLEISPRNA